MFLVNGNDYNESVFIWVTGLVAIGASTVFLLGAWSVFGPGSYLKRLILSHLLAAIVGLGFLLGSISLLDDVFGSVDATELLKGLSYLMLAIPPISLAAQLPFWFFRFFFGWQFTFGESEPVESFTLRDIFVFTSICALGFATPQMAINQASNDSWYDATSSYELVTHPDGSTSYEVVELTDPAEIERRRMEQIGNNRMRFLSAYGVSAVWILGFTVLTFPVLAIMFRSRQTGFGCGIVVAYAAMWLALVILVLSLLWGGSGVGEGFGYLAFLLMTYTAAVAIPCAISRETGFRLTSPRRYRRNIAKSQEASGFKKPAPIPNEPETLDLKTPDSEATQDKDERPSAKK